MKKIGLICILTTALLTACNNNGEKEAVLHLKKAKLELANGNYNEAKLQIDSIRNLYPKAFEARKEAIKVMQQIDLKEQQKSLVYLDSMLVVKEAKLDSIKGKFVLEKDTAYQEVGNYFYPSQTVEKNSGRSFLRAQVNEIGDMSLTSIYCAGGNIHHTSIKVINGDIYAETLPTRDSYETNDLGRPIEKADYKISEDGGVTAFVVSNRDSNIKLQFIGDKTYTTIMPKSDRDAITEISELAKLLSSIAQIRTEKKEANLKIEFVKRKMQEDNK